MRISKAWKDFERECARYFKGIRRVRISYGERGSDIIHPIYSIECKYGKQIPQKALEGKPCKFLDAAFAQAMSYNPTLIPVVCLKSPGMRGFVYITLDATKVTRVTRVPLNHPTSAR